MAVSIMEPSELPSGSITPETQDRYKILVYEQAPDGAGIKRLGIGEWKDYLSFNNNKVDNLASFVGPDSDYDWESETPNPYTGTALSTRIQAVADKVGVSTDPELPFTPITDRIEELKDWVKDGWDDSGTPVDGLLDRMTANETAVSNISTEIGDTVTGGILKDINDINTTIGADDTSGLRLRIKTNEDNIADINTTIGSDDTSGLRLRIKTNEDDITSIKDELGDVTTIPSGSSIMDEINTSKEDIVNLKSAVSGAYTVQGDVIGADSTGIIITGNTHIDFTDLQNGWVYNVNPTSPATELEVKGVIYQKGANIVWVDNLDDFDELGTAINVQELEDLKTDVNDLKTRVTGLEDRFVTADFQWTSSGLTGFYLMNVTYNNAISGQKSASCLFNFISGQKVMSVDLTQNYTDFFNDVAGNKVQLNTSLPATTSVYQIKLS